MPFPKIFLNRSKRLTFMLILIAAFFIISPLIIAYTAGYRYDFKTGKIKMTGVISIDAKPTDAKVVINKIAVDKKLPIWLPNTAPGNYQVTISRDGYWNWSKEISVESKQTSYIKNITLFKKSTLTDFYQQNNNSDTAFSSDGTWALTIDKTNERAILLNTVNQSNKNIYNLSGVKNYSFNWSPYFDLFYIYINDPNNKSIILFDPNDTENYQVTKFTDEQTNTWQWTKEFPGLYLRDSDKNNTENIYLVTLNDKNQRVIGSPSSTIWFVEGNALNENIWYFNTSTEQLTKKSNDGLANNFSVNKNIDKLININKQRIIATEDNQTLIIKIDNNQVIDIKEIPTNNFFYNSQTDEWLAFSDWEIWSIYPDGTTSLLNRIGEKINSAIPLDNFGVILIASENKLMAFNPGYYTTQDLANNLTIEKISADVSRRIIYLVDKKSGSNIKKLEY